MGFKSLKFVGCGDAFGSGGRYQTCFLVMADEVNFLIDLGSTAFLNLQKSIDLTDIDLIIISHFHADHYGGLPFFLLNSEFIEKRNKPLTIVGPPDCENRIRNLSEAYYVGFYEKISFPILYNEYGSESQSIHDLEISSCEVLHAPQSNPHAVRIQSNGNSLTFSGDSEWTDDLLKISDGTDIFICECNSFDQNIPGHINYNELEQKLGDYYTGKTYLTHMGADMLSIQTKLKAATRFYFAQDNLEIDL